MELRIYQDPVFLAANAALRVATAAQAAIAAQGEFAWCVSGGRTPEAVYERLARPELASQIDWQRTRIFFGDERYVPADDAQSNYRMLEQSLLAHVPIPEANVFRIATQAGDPERDARAYEVRLWAARGVGTDGAPERPFDLVMLGMGDDGHTASIFPGAPPEAVHWVSARKHASGQARITLTERALNRTALAMFLITGKDKAERVAEVLEGPRAPLQLPAQRIAPSGELIFLLDRAAASELSRA
jgi:6-phosphogluconolactonase